VDEVGSKSDRWLHIKFNKIVIQGIIWQKMHENWSHWNAKNAKPEVITPTKD